MKIPRVKRTLLDICVGVIGVLVFWAPFTTAAASSTGFRVVLLAAVAIGLVLREWIPVLGFMFVLVATIIGTTVGFTNDPFILAAWALYPLATSYGAIRPLRFALGLLAFLVFLGSFAVVPGTEDTVRNGLLSFVVLAGSWALGSSARNTRIEQEHTARVEQEQAVTAERLHVAREVHDVLSHSLASISVTAAVASHRAEQLTREELAARLAQVEATSQEALRDLKSVLGGIRSDGGSTPESGANTLPHLRADEHSSIPQPTLDDIPSLVKRAVSSGLQVELTVDGPARYSPTTELAIYRVVQEGLTNVSKHAPGSRCRVLVSTATGAARVSVENSAPATFAISAASDAAAPAFGLRGLHERITQLGGTFETGHTNTGGFLIVATIPASPQAASWPATESSLT